ncbi:MAG: TatD family hydrolase [Candidatus Verstraetearchaeota archaeon]|nr:TatD family hydrolase [Candidatus Verstraetearchaeota archaeon]
MIDVHAHLTDGSYSDLPEVLKRAREAGLEHIIISITDPPEIVRAREVLAMAPGFISLTIGLDPMALSEDKYRKFEALVEAERVVGIGEVGLDHFYARDHGMRNLQMEFFRRCIRLAMRKGLPLVVHSRSAGHVALEVLYSEGADKVLMHAFDGKSGDARLAAERGFYFSIPTSVVYSQQKQKLVKNLPLDSLMLETDSPVLSPVRGVRNEPTNLIYALRKVAEIKRTTEEEVARVTTENAKKLFRL